MKTLPDDKRRCSTIRTGWNGFVYDYWSVQNIDHKNVKHHQTTDSRYQRIEIGFRSALNPQNRSSEPFAALLMCTSGIC